MRNLGTTAWYAGSGHALAVLSDPNNVFGGAQRFGVLGDQVVLSDQTTNFFAYLTAPAAPGSYPVQLRMVEEFVEFFGETINLTVNVEIPPNAARDWESYR
jgi:hypothetical protein